MVELGAPRRLQLSRHWLGRLGHGMLRLWQSLHHVLTQALLLILVLTLLYGLWPYSTLWSLERAVVQEDFATIAALVNLDAVRDELARRLDKRQTSRIETVSDVFIAWLESGLRQHGVAVLERRVTLQWVSDQFKQIPTLHRPGLWRSLSEVFFEAPDAVRLRIERTPTAPPLYVRLQLDGLTWRVTLLHD